MGIELPPKFEDGLGYLVHQLMYGFRRNFIRESEAAGVRITPEEMVVLVLLYQQGGQTQTELASKLAKDKAVITRMLAGLEKRGMVRRQPDADDRRATRTYLTEEGSTTFEKLKPLLETFILRVLIGVSQQEFDTTRQTLLRMIGNLEEME